MAWMEFDISCTANNVGHVFLIQLGIASIPKIIDYLLVSRNM